MGGVSALLKGSPGAPMNDAFLAYVSDDASFQVARAVAGEMGWATSVVRRGGAGDVLDLFAHEQGLSAQVLVVDLDGAANPVATVARLASLVGSGDGGGRLVGLGTANDVDLYRDLMAAGAADYLVKPLTPDALHTVIRAAKQTPRRAQPKEVTPARLVVVVGVRGGVGASTAAVNAAWIIGHELKRKTALLDLDLHFGTDALALDLEPGRGLREALESPTRLDTLLVASSMANESEWLSVLGAEEPVEDSVRFEPAAVATLLEELRGGFDVVIVDMPRHLLPSHRMVLGEADQIVLVSDMTLAGIRDTARLAASIKVLGGPECLVVAGRVGGGRKLQVDQATFERGVQGKLAHILPEDDKAVAAAANRGRAVAAEAPSSAAAKAFRRLAQLLAGAEPPKGRSWGVLSWIGKGREAKP